MWQGACVVGVGMHSRGACVMRVCMVGEHAWQGDMCGGCVWQGAYMAGACGRGHALEVTKEVTDVK